MPIQIPRAKPFLNRNKFVFSSLCEIRVCHLPQDNLQSWRDQALPLPTCLPPSTPSTLLSPICLQRRRFQSSTLGAVSLSLCPRRCAHWFAFQMLCGADTTWEFPWFMATIYKQLWSQSKFLIDEINVTTLYWLLSPQTTSVCHLSRREAISRERPPSKTFRSRTILETI